ncbi:MAG TPA: DUF167 domain-containing protein [Dehalococcoidia bacterium]|nr:DUF167 domain-containing protein [Dehalococcoidia bacterium]
MLKEQNKKLTEYKNNTVTRLYVRVTPRASRNEIIGFTDGVLYVKVVALPDRGKANRELIDYLSGILGIKKSSLHLLKGHTSRNKVIAVDGLNLADIIQRISALPFSSDATT